MVLAGFAMGAGEVTRYLAVHGPGRVKAAALVAPLLPFLLKTHDNPDGIDRSVFDGITARIAADRPAAMKDFRVTACLEDFRGDLATISIPVVVIHGDQDRVLPYEATSQRLPASLNEGRSTIITGGPHAIMWTHADEFNQALLDFTGHPGRAGRRYSGPENPPQNGRAG